MISILDPRCGDGLEDCFDVLTCNARMGGQFFREFQGIALRIGHGFNVLIGNLAPTITCNHRCVDEPVLILDRLVHSGFYLLTDLLDGRRGLVLYLRSRSPFLFVMFITSQVCAEKRMIVEKWRSAHIDIYRQFAWRTSVPYSCDASRRTRGSGRPRQRSSIQSVR